MPLPTKTIPVHLTKAEILFLFRELNDIHARAFFASEDAPDAEQRATTRAHCRSLVAKLVEADEASKE